MACGHVDERTALVEAVEHSLGDHSRTVGSQDDTCADYAVRKYCEHGLEVRSKVFGPTQKLEDEVVHILNLLIVEVLAKKSRSLDRRTGCCSCLGVSDEHAVGTMADDSIVMKQPTLVSAAQLGRTQVEAQS